MRTLLAFLLIAGACQAETFTAWVSESWKARTTNWTVQVMDETGALVGKDIAGVETDLGIGSGASVRGTIVTTTAPNQWVRVQFYDSDVTDYPAANVPYYLGANGVKAEPTDPIYADTQQIRNTDLPAVKTDTAATLADTDEMQQDQQAGGRLDNVWSATNANTDTILTDTATLKTSTTDIYTDTQALQALLSGVNVTQISGGVPRTELDKTWDALASNHVITNSFGKILQDLSIGQDPTAFAAAVWSAAYSDYYTGQAGSFGELAADWVDGRRLDLILDAVKSDTTNILADTNELQTDWTSGGRLDVILARVDTNATQLITDVGGVQADTTQLITDVAAVKGDTGPLAADWANNGRLDLILDAVKSDTTATLADTATLKTTTTNIYTDTQALQPLLTGVNLLTILGAEPLGQIGTGVWEALTAAHSNPNTFGAYIQSISTSSPDDVAAAVWNAARASFTVVGSMGEAMGWVVSLYNDWQPAGRLEVLLQQAATTGTGTQPVILTDVDQEPVPGGRTVVLVQSSTGLIGEFSETVRTGIQNTWAVDFRNDVSINDRIVETAPPVIVSGPAGGMTFPEVGRDQSLAKLRVAVSAPGTYVVDVTVTYSTGSQAKGRVTWVAVE